MISIFTTLESAQNPLFFTENTGKVVRTGGNIPCQSEMAAHAS